MDDDGNVMAHAVIIDDEPPITDYRYDDVNNGRPGMWKVIRITSIARGYGKVALGAGFVYDPEEKEPIGPPNDTLESLVALDDGVMIYSQYLRRRRLASKVVRGNQARKKQKKKARRMMQYR